MKTPRTHAELFAAVRQSVEPDAHISVDADITSCRIGSVKILWKIYVDSRWNNFARPAESIAEAWEAFATAIGLNAPKVDSELDAHSIEPVEAAHA